MMHNHGNTNERNLLNPASFGALALAVFLSVLPLSAQQNQTGAQGQPDQPAATLQQFGQPTTGSAPQGAPPLPATPAPQTLTLPAGTVIPVRTTDWLASNKNHPGDTFSAVLDQPLVVDGWVVARRGQTVIGRVDVADKTKGVSHLGVELSELTLVDGQQFPLRTELVQASAAPSNWTGRDINTVGTTTAIGTIVGGVVGGGTGAAIGAGAGLTAGTAGVLATHGKPTVISPETLLTFRLAVPIAISTERSQVAFRPVTQGDYNRDADAYAGFASRRFVDGGPAYPPPSPYYYGYPYAYPYSYPYWGPAYLGFYGGWGSGSRFGFGRGGFRR